MNLDTAGVYVRSRVASIMNSPLITTPGERPARLCVVESAMNALGSLATVLHDDTADPATSDTSGRALLPQLIDDWNDYVEAFHTHARRHRRRTRKTLPTWACRQSTPTTG